MHTIYIITILGLSQLCIITNAWNIDKSTNKVTSAALGMLLLSNPVLAADSSTSALEQVARVKYSLSYVNSDIEKASEAEPIVNQIKLLLNNYKLRENVQASLSLSNNREEAKTHGLAAWEDLIIISEYFEADIDPITGKKRPPPAALKLSYDAVTAAEKEFDLYFASFPSGLRSSIESKIKAEFNY
jgi:hypothetical protein